MQQRRLYLLIALLVISVAILATLNARGLTDAEELERTASLSILETGEELGRISRENLMALETVTFTVEQQSSSAGALHTTFTGVALHGVLAQFPELDLSSFTRVDAQAIDGYLVSFSREDVMRSDHVYVVFQADGNLLEGKRDGGSGPLMIVPRQDPFAQRWVKFAIRLDVQ